MDEIKVSTVLDLIKNKNHMGFELFYSYHYRLVFGAAFSVTGNEEDSRDVVQNVVYKLAKLPADKFPTKGEVSWLYRVAKNEAINYVKTRKQYDPIDEKFDIPTHDANIGEFVDMDSYYSLIESLNEKQREVVTLKVIGDYSHKEISKLLDKPIGTIQWIYNTSIKRLRVALATMATFAVAFIIGATSRAFNVLGGGQGDTPYSDDPPVYDDPSTAYDPPVFDDPTIPYDPPVFDDPTLPFDPEMHVPLEDITEASPLINDGIFIALIVGLCLMIIGIILFLKFSHKIPTKKKR